MAGDLTHLSTCRTTITNVDGNDIVTLDIGRPNTNVLLHGHTFDVTGGSAATYQLYIGETATFTAGDVNTRYIGSAGVAVATITRTRFSPPIPARCDASGYLYLQCGFNAGADNDAVYLLDYETILGS